MSKHTMTRSGAYTYVNGNVWYEADSSGSHIFYELDYLQSYYNKPVTNRWGDGGYHTGFDSSRTIVGNLLCWKERIVPSNWNHDITGTYCFWSNTAATRRLQQNGVTALYAGVNENDIRIKSVKTG